MIIIVVNNVLKLRSNTTPLFITGIRSFSAAPSDDVVIPEIVDTLEWVLDSPPNVHQFDEPPIVVEVEHLDNLIIDEDH